MIYVCKKCKKVFFQNQWEFGKTEPKCCSKRKWLIKKSSCGFLKIDVDLTIEEKIKILKKYHK